MDQKERKKFIKGSQDQFLLQEDQKGIKIGIKREPKEFF